MSEPIIVKARAGRGDFGWCAGEDLDAPAYFQPALLLIFPDEAARAQWGWQKAEGNPPPLVGDSRKLVWLEDREGMCWIGIRAYRHDLHFWTANGAREESATVRYWAHLPAAPPPEEPR